MCGTAPQTGGSANSDSQGDGCLMDGSNVCSETVIRNPHLELKLRFKYVPKIQSAYLFNFFVCYVFTLTG